jgi:hypothetical protein
MDSWKGVSDKAAVVILKTSGHHSIFLGAFREEHLRRLWCFRVMEDTLLLPSDNEEGEGVNEG